MATVISLGIEILYTRNCYSYRGQISELCNKEKRPKLFKKVCYSFTLFGLQEARPENYVECFIAEQNLVGVAIGAACRDRTVPFASTFACFLSRAYDQLRMAAVSQTNANFCGSHVGVSIGENFVFLVFIF